MAAAVWSCFISTMGAGRAALLTRCEKKSRNFASGPGNAARQGRGRTGPERDPNGDGSQPTAEMEGQGERANGPTGTLPRMVQFPWRERSGSRDPGQ